MKVCRGVSLIEVMVALAVLMVGAVALVGLQLQLLRTQQNSQQHAAALVLAQRKLEELRSFQSVYRWPGLFAYQDIAHNQGGGERPGFYEAGQLQLSWRSQDGPPLIHLGNLPAFKRVDVQTLWLDEQQQWQSVVLSGVITPYPALSRRQLDERSVIR